MKEIYVANTDNEWFDFLQERKPWEEVNFWKPSQQVFKAIDEGGLFVFRLKAPRNVIGGYGVLVSSINAPIRLAWDSIGQGNGVPSIEKMVSSIARYRSSRDTTEHSMIGCRLLMNPVFFDDHEWFDVPADWSQNIVTGKVYDIGSTEGRRLLDRLEERVNATLLPRVELVKFEGFGETEQSRFGSPVQVAPRLGQGSFRLKVSGAYEFSCAISDTRVIPALEAAHIKPYSEGGTHGIDNGILLRRDIHSVFDSGFATIDEKYRFVVSNKIRDIFNNGHEYLKLHGREVRLPNNRSYWPQPDNLNWHRENRYVGE